LSERRFPRYAVCVLASVMLVSWLTGAQSASAADGATVEEVVQAIHSFQQLAILDPATAGEVWMEGREASSWKRDVEEAIGDLFEATILFGHMIPLAAADETGVWAALYSPWVGMLLLFTYDPLATVVTSYSIHPAEKLDDSAGGPLAFATAAMTAIDSIVATFDAFQNGETPREELSARDLGRRVDDATDRLAIAYADPEGASEAAPLSSALDRLFAEDLEGPLTILEAESYSWVDSLLPLWIRAEAGSTYVVLASMEAPLDWAWLETDDDASRSIRSVSAIRLYDRIVTREGDES